jgi:hypothetical protein
MNEQWLSRRAMGVAPSQSQKTKKYLFVLIGIVNTNQKPIKSDGKTVDCLKPSGCFFLRR